VPYFISSVCCCIALIHSKRQESCECCKNTVFIFFSISGNPGFFFNVILCKFGLDFVKERIMKHFKYNYYSSALLLLSLQIACQEKPKQGETPVSSSKTMENLADDTASQESISPKPSKLDSIDQANAQSVQESDEITKAYVNLTSRDSTIRLHANIRIDHRFFGYEQADTQATKLLLFSIFTDDVEHNPFQLKFGAYYDTSGLESKGLKLKYAGLKGDFVAAKIMDATNIPVSTVYFESKWVEVK
jgi:hypothetical protein